MVKKYSDNDSECTMESDIYGEGIKYSTINKLRKSGSVVDSEMIGPMLKSAAARKLWGMNIRVHPKHYAPKDRRKYFHESEISGGRLNLLEAIKQMGSYGKAKFNNLVTGTKSYINTVVSGRNDYPPKVRQFLEKYGNKTISSITIDRTLVPGLLSGALNAVSRGKFLERMKSEPYDKLFHLRIDITLHDGTKLALEKNEVINMYLNPTIQKNSEQKDVPNIPDNLTINELLEGGKKIQGGKFFKYSAYDNNCQDFILALLQGSHIGDSQDYEFVKQSTENLFKENGKSDVFLRKVANTVTDLGAKVNELTTGTGIENHQVIQSVLFTRPEWSKKKAEAWLKKHEFKGLEVDEKPNHYRYRQVDPKSLEQKGYHYITKSIGKDIEFIIGYKDMEREDYESDSSTSSEESIKSTGKNKEKHLVKKINKLSKEIHDHQKIHGGSLDIGAAFRNLGNTIKSGFEDKIINPIKNDVIEPVGKYVTAKQGGLASDLLHKALPMATGTLTGAAAEMLFPEGGPVSGIVGNQAGKYAGTKLADYIGQQTGTGIKKRGRRPKGSGDLVHIDIASHNAKGKTVTNKMEGDGILDKLKKEISKRKTTGVKNSALEQLVSKHREKEERMLSKALLTMAKDKNEENHPKVQPKHSRPLGAGFKKGSPEAKEHMARLRAMRTKKIK